jgi:hypothetical protein
MDVWNNNLRYSRVINDPRYIQLTRRINNEILRGRDGRILGIRNPTNYANLQIGRSVLFQDIEREMYGDNIFYPEIVQVQRNRYVGIDNYVDAIGTVLTDRLNEGEQYLLRINEDTFYTLTTQRMNSLLSLLNNMQIEESLVTGSDRELINNLRDISRFSVQRIDQVERNRRLMMGRRVGGAFFNMTIKEDIKLKLDKYGIFKKVDKKNYTDNCLVVALKEGGICKDKLDKIRYNIFDQIIPKYKLEEISKDLEIVIKLKALTTNGKIDKVRTFPKDKSLRETYEDEINIGNINNHYFINDKTEYTKYSIENYDKINEREEYNLYINNTRKRNGRGMKSFDLINYIYTNKNKFLCKINYDNEILETYLYDRTDNIKNLKYPKTHSRKVKIKKPRIIKGMVNIFFDFESYRDLRDNINKPYLCCYVDNKNNEKTFIGGDCAKQMLDDISNNNDKVLLIAHNVSFDFNFIIRHLTIMSLIKKGSKVISCSAIYKNCFFTIKDSLSLISMPLRKFGETFGLKTSKEIMPYTIYDKYFSMCDKTEETGLYPIKDALKELEDKSEEDKKDFIKNIEEWNLRNEDDFYLIDYSAKYCLIDCIVLRDGYNKFREWINDLCDIDINNKLTLPSLADTFFINSGCYVDIHEISGIPREYIQRSVVGGRVMCCENKKIKIIDKILADFDAVSLYPSAMDYLTDVLGGFLIGSPKVLSNSQLNMKFLNSVNGYFIRIKINKVGIHRKFPLLSINKKGVRNFTNDLVGSIHYIDKISLEDCVEFQKIEYDIIDGYYFNEGRNKNIGKEINKIFNARLKMKKDENPMQLVYKLLMNSSYGKTILKPISSESKIINSSYDKSGKFQNAEEKLKHFLKINYDSIKDVKKICEGMYCVKKNKSILKHFNRVHVGVEILSMSKRIMNRVMCIAEDKGIDIYYQDTDSMQLEKKNVELLGKYYGEKYNKELIGKSMGQFHIDYEIKGAIPKTIEGYKAIYLGKKTYCVLLRGICKETGKILYGEHVRFKGVSNDSIKYTAKLRKCSVFDIYQKLYDGEKIEFDLLCGNKKIQLQFVNYVIKSVPEFKRTIQFA